MPKIINWQKQKIFMASEETLGKKIAEKWKDDFITNLPDQLFQGNKIRAVTDPVLIKKYSEDGIMVSFILMFQFSQINTTPFKKEENNEPE